MTTDDGSIYWNPMVPELTVTNFSASLNFYIDVLGFSIMFQRYHPDFAYLALGKVQLMLEANHADSWNVDELIKPLGRGINLQIEVEDIDSILCRVKKYAVPVYRDISDNYYDINNSKVCQREFLIQDPDGYLLRFSQYIDNLI